MQNDRIRKDQLTTGLRYIGLTIGATCIQVLYDIISRPLYLWANGQMKYPGRSVGQLVKEGWFDNTFYKVLSAQNLNVMRRYNALPAIVRSYGVFFGVGISRGFDHPKITSAMSEQSHQITQLIIVTCAASAYERFCMNVMDFSIRSPLGHLSRNFLLFATLDQVNKHQGHHSSQQKDLEALAKTALYAGFIKTIITLPYDAYVMNQNFHLRTEREANQLLRNWHATTGLPIQEIRVPMPSTISGSIRGIIPLGIVMLGKDILWAGYTDKITQAVKHDFKAIGL